MSYEKYIKQSDACKLSSMGFTEDFIKKLHTRYSSEASSDYRSALPTSEEFPHKVAKAEDLPHLMTHYISQVEISSYSLHPIEVAAIAYKRFLDISPFYDGNETTAMAIAAYILQKNGFFFQGIPNELKEDQKNALCNAAKTGMPDDLITLFAKAVTF